MANLLIESLRKKEVNLQNQLEIVRSMIQDEIRKSDENRSGAKVGEFYGGGDIESLGKSVPQKFLGVLKKNQRFMKVREIAKEIVSVEGGNEDDLVPKLSRRTRKLRELNKIVKYQVGNSRANVFWGSPNWLENGEIKKDFEYDPKAISERGSNPLADFDL